MKCMDVNERLTEYWDMSAQDPIRQEMDRHIASCEACSEELRIWEESVSLIRNAQQVPDYVGSGHTVVSSVMDRIYQDERWRLPVAFRNYTFSFQVRKRIMACIAMCMTIFIVSFAYSFIDNSSNQQPASFSGFIDTAHAQSADMPAMFRDVPLASISSPSVLRVGPIQTYTDYLLVASIIGFIFTLLTMNWLSRLRA